MAKVVIDIETSGTLFDELDDHTQNYFLKSAKTPEEIATVKEQTALSPVTGEIVAIGMYDPDAQKGIVFFQDRGTGVAEWEEAGIVYKPGDERFILENFWQQVKRFGTVITFNGRGFDAPFIIMRSVILGIKITKDLMPNRFSPDAHYDLQDQLTFYGATKRFSLDMYSRIFGIPTPKDGGIEGKEVSQAFRDGRYVEIAKYNGRDIVATALVYQKWCTASARE